MARERGLVVSTTRIFRRLWQLYAAYVVLFVIYIDVISNVAAQYAATEIIDEYNVTGLVDYPTQTLMHGLLLQAKPLNLDTLQLFVALMAFFPLVLWAMLRRPHLALAGSIALYRGGPPVWLDLPLVSVRGLVLQSVFLAAPVRARGLVRAERLEAREPAAAHAAAASARLRPICCSAWR